MEASHRLQSHGRARDPRGHLEPHGERGQERRAVEPLALTHRERRRQHGAARVRPGERLALERADQDPVGEGGPGDVRSPLLLDHGCLGRPTERADHRHDSPGPWLDGPHEAGTDRIEDGDLAVVDQTPRQVGESRLGHESGQLTSLVHVRRCASFARAILSAPVGGHRGERRFAPPDFHQSRTTRPRLDRFSGRAPDVVTRTVSLTWSPAQPISKCRSSILRISPATSGVSLPRWSFGRS